MSCVLAVPINPPWWGVFNETPSLTQYCVSCIFEINSVSDRKSATQAEACFGDSRARLVTSPEQSQLQRRQQQPSTQTALQSREKYFSSKEFYQVQIDYLLYFVLHSELFLLVVITAHLLHHTNTPPSCAAADQRWPSPNSLQGAPNTIAAKPLRRESARRVDDCCSKCVQSWFSALSKQLQIHQTCRGWQEIITLAGTHHTCVYCSFIWCTLPHHNK